MLRCSSHKIGASFLCWIKSWWQLAKAAKRSDAEFGAELWMTLGFVCEHRTGLFRNQHRPAVFLFIDNSSVIDNCVMSLLI